MGKRYRFYTTFMTSVGRCRLFIMAGPPKRIHQYRFDFGAIHSDKKLDRKELMVAVNKKWKD